MSLTYNQLIQLNRSFVNAHHVLKNFGNGIDAEKVLHNQEPSYKYPLMWMEDLPGPISPGKDITAFRVYFLSQVEMIDRDDPAQVDEPLMQNNITEVKSDMKQCAQDFLSYWAQQHEYPKLKIEQNTAVNFVEDTTFDSLYGVYVDVNFYQEFRWNTCSIPMGTPTPLPNPCSPGFVFANDTLVFQVSSGGKYYFTIVDEEGETINYVWDEEEQKFVIPSMGAGIDIDINGASFYVGQTSDADIPVKDSTGTNNVGSKVGSQWRIADSNVIVKNTIDDELVNVNVSSEQDTELIVGDCEQTLNGDGITAQPAETSKAIIIVNSEDDNIGTPVVDNAGMLEVLIGNSEVEINDSTGGPLYLESVKAEGSKTRIITDGSVILKNAQGDTLQTITNKAQEAKVVTMPIIYIRPMVQIGSVTYKTGDWGWRVANNPDLYVPPSVGIPALLNPANPLKLLNKNAFGHTWRFTGALGGYYDADTDQYKLADGTVSDLSNTFGSGTGFNGYRICHHTGTGHKYTVNGSMTFANMVTAAHALNIGGLTGFEIMSINEFNLIIRLFLQTQYNPLFPAYTDLNPISPYNQSIKLCNNGPADPVNTSLQFTGGNITSNRADATNDGWIPIRYHYT